MKYITIKEAAWFATREPSGRHESLIKWMIKEKVLDAKIFASPVTSRQAQYLHPKAALFLRAHYRMSDIRLSYKLQREIADWIIQTPFRKIMSETYPVCMGLDMNLNDLRADLPRLRETIYNYVAHRPAISFHTKRKDLIRVHGHDIPKMKIMQACEDEIEMIQVLQDFSDLTEQLIRSVQIYLFCYPKSGL